MNPINRTKTSPRRIVAGLLCALALQATSVTHAACPRAVFFDLGNTLVEAGPGGLQVVRVGAQETVDALQAAGVRIGVITNVPAGFTRDQLNALLATPAFLDEFEVVVMSSEAPAPKPSPLIYTHAHAQLSSPPLITETAFVGETLGEIANAAVSPTAGARSVGMIGIHLSNAAPSALADFTIPTNGLTQIVPLVANLCALHEDGFEAVP